MITRKEPPTKEEILRMLASGEISMLPTAEVEGRFVPQTKEEADAYRNLGVEGAMRMRDMQRSVTGARNRFAEEAMVPAAEAVMNAEGITSLPALVKLLRSPKVISRLLAKKGDSESAKSAEMVSQRISSMRDKYGLKSDDLQKQSRRALDEAAMENAQAVENLQMDLDKILMEAKGINPQAVEKLQMELNKILMEAKSVDDLQQKAYRALLRGEHEYFLDKVQGQEFLDKIEDLYNYGSKMKLDRAVTERELAMGVLDPQSSILREGFAKKNRGFKPIKKDSPQMNQRGGLIRR
jgi:hypothetical protein